MPAVAVTGSIHKWELKYILPVYSVGATYATASDISLMCTPLMYTVANL
jgi:hypothetical protein